MCYCYCIHLCLKKKFSKNINNVLEKNFVLAYFISVYAVSSNGLLHGSQNRELERYKERVKLLHTVLLNECKQGNTSRMRREIISSSLNMAREEMEKLLYERMLRMLIDCRKQKLSTKLTQKTTQITSTKLTKKTTQLTSTTTELPLLAQCILAINFTESWRLDHKGSKIRPDGTYNCDTRQLSSRKGTWFRFSASGGTHLLESCPPDYSCGSQIGFWSDEAKPKLETGHFTKVKVYGSWVRECKQYEIDLTVGKCSERPNDYIYQYNGDSMCGDSFCGQV